MAGLVDLGFRHSISLGGHLREPNAHMHMDHFMVGGVQQCGCHDGECGVAMQDMVIL